MNVAFGMKRPYANVDHNVAQISVETASVLFTPKLVKKHGDCCSMKRTK